MSFAVMLTHYAAWLKLPSHPQITSTDMGTYLEIHLFYTDKHMKNNVQLQTCFGYHLNQKKFSLQHSLRSFLFQHYVSFVKIPTQWQLTSSLKAVKDA
jgi:hypothetical protein